MKLVIAHPETGHPAQEFPPGYRERWISFGRGGYVVFYRIGEKVSVVIAVGQGREARYS